MKKKLVVLMVCFVGLIMMSGMVRAEESIYGHVSFVEATPKVIRADKTEEIAVVNLPLVPGDTIVNGADSRCEIQFDNGTVMRLDRNSILKIVTVQANSLTSKWKMTTLGLLKGNLYTLNQSYNLERFQVITANAAINLKHHSVSTILVKDNGETDVFSDKGRFYVMYGGNPNALKTETVKAGNGFTITADNEFHVNKQRDVDFVAWNQYIDRNFEDLHTGINKVPKKIYKYSKGIVAWAEKWSTKYGEWIYDDLFGYVWKPGDERFAVSERPFFQAKFVRINKELFVVPAEKWGWAPAHLGTWVWLKTGWRWVPGSSFSNGCDFLFMANAEFSAPMYANTLNCWIENWYGSIDLYLIYHRFGYERWHDDYMDQYKKAPVKPKTTHAPAHVVALMKKLDRASLDNVTNRLKNYPHKTSIFAHETGHKAIPATDGRGIVKPVIAKHTEDEARNPVKGMGSFKKDAVARPGIEKRQAEQPEVKKEPILDAGYYRDFNPDKKWAKKHGIAVYYSSATNDVICPKLKLSSSTMTIPQRINLRNSTSHKLTEKNFTSRSSGYGDTSGGNSSSTSATHSTPAQNGNVGIIRDSVNTNASTEDKK